MIYKMTIVILKSIVIAFLRVSFPVTVIFRYFIFFDMTKITALQL